MAVNPEIWGRHRTPQLCFLTPKPHPITETLQLHGKQLHSPASAPAPRAAYGSCGAASAQRGGQDGPTNHRPQPP